MKTTDGSRMRTSEMSPMEAWRIISQCMQELVRCRQAMYPGSKGWCEQEAKAEVIAFEALRRMEEDKEE